MLTVKSLDALASQGRISRRDFVRQSMVFGTAAALALGRFDAVRAATPQKGGTFRQALTGGSSGDVLDPAKILDSYMINVSFGQLRSCLTEVAPDGSLRGELAESWEASDDATRWRFKLRKGVEFHNAKSLTPEDVVASFNHHRGEDAGSAAKGIVEAITDIRIDGDWVVFDLDGGNADFPFICSDYHLAVCPARDDGTMDWQSGVGTGGYMLENFDPGVNTITKRFPNYWKENAAYFDSVENLFIADVAARTNGLRSDELDSIANLDLKTLHLLKRDPNIAVVPTNGNKHCTFPMLCDVAPFDNVDIRLAIKYAVDREELLQKILKGLGEVGNDSPIGPANIYRATPEELPLRPYDPDKAKWHLQQAGHDGLAVTLHTADSAFEGAVDAAELISQSAQAAGIEIKVQREPDDGYWSNVWLVKPWCASYWGGRPTEDWMFSQVYSKGADWNESHWDNERFNTLLVEARAELDTTKRRQMYVEMQQLCSDDGGALIPLFMAYTQAVRSRVGLPEQLANNWELDGHRNAERWWFNG
ncbi:MAG: ABC transporter substrate-binding protein [Geminicoccaceae bacterium]|nr:ABC transporter substrate-binding protein [Geminicoccaceae bacterium]